MLSQLYIENIAVIEQAEIIFTDGFIALTGETGAGKSIIIDAINAVMGGRVSKDIVRTGESAAFVSALFSDITDFTKKIIEGYGFLLDDEGSVLIQRTISREGKSTAKINGRPATVAILRDLGGTLLNIHGQHENQALLNVENHLHYLDKLAEDEQLLTRYQTEYESYCRLETKIKKFRINEDEKNKRADILRFQTDEIAAAELKPGELDVLEAKRDYLVHAEHINSCVQNAHLSLYGDEELSGALSLLSTAAEYLKESAEMSSTLVPLSEKCSEILFLLEDLGVELREFQPNEEVSVSEIDTVVARIEAIQKLIKKYGQDEETVLQYYAGAVQELSALDHYDEEITKLYEEEQQHRQSVMQLAEQLSEARKKAVKIFAGRVREELTFLDMPQVRLAVAFRKTELNSFGIDSVEFLISANPGEDPKSIAKIASGGELSRIMLAIKNVLAERDEIYTLIFDEIDTGISGRAAYKVGKKLREAAQTRQIICVTHLAQIASLAHTQMFIEKNTEDGKTYTQVKTLDDDGRKREIARIIGGDNITEATLKSAEEMLHNI